MFSATALPTVGHADVIIHEIMYHPLEPWPPASPYPVTNRTEFVEIYNAGASRVDLGRYRLEDGVDFQFPAGSFLDPDQFGIVVENLPAFTSAYPFVVGSVLGTFEGALSNGGERLALSCYTNGQWVVVDALRYIDDPSSDNTGRSLELIHPAFARLDNQAFGDWGPSTVDSGTPGQPNTAYQPYPRPVVGDVRHDPPIPPPNSSVLITAQVAGRDGAPTTVQLKHRLDLNPKIAWSTLAMNDSGDQGDAVAGDGVYSIMYPPFGGTPMSNGSVLEFMIETTDAYGTRLAPATNRAGVVTGTPSYLCKFQTDTYYGVGYAAYPGEYPTFHILMTAANQYAYQTSPTLYMSDTACDATLITAEGNVIYNCAFRYRGSNSRDPMLGNYRVDLPNSTRYKDNGSVIFNYVNAMDQHLGAQIMDKANDGYVSLSELTRVFLRADYKKPQPQGVYNRLEIVNNDMMERIYGNSDGNIYSGKEVTSGDLTALSPISAYYPLYQTDVNNPHTIWTELDALCTSISPSQPGYPGSITNHMNWRQWARHFAGLVLVDNYEGGYACPYPGRTSGDELRVYALPGGRVFDIYPWDFDTCFYSPTAHIWTWGSTVPNYLFKAPIIHHYVGALIDDARTLITDQAISNMLAGLGSIADVDATYKNGVSDKLKGIRASIFSQIGTNLTVNGYTPGAAAVVVTRTNGTYALSLSGKAPQNYTAHVTAGGVQATWDARNNAWTMPQPLAITGNLATVRVEARDTEGRLLQSLDVPVVARGPTVLPVSGMLAGSTSWSPAGGTYHCTDHITVPAGSSLSIAPGTLVTFASGKVLTVEGTLDAGGTPEAPVLFYPNDGVSAFGVVLRGASAGGRLSHVELAGGYLTATNAADLVLDDSELRGYSAARGLLSAYDSAVVIRRTRFADYGRVVLASSAGTIDKCLFERYATTALDVSGAGPGLDARRFTLRQALSAAASGLLLRDGAIAGVSNVWVASGGTIGMDVRNSAALTLRSAVIHDTRTALRAGAGTTLAATHVSAAGVTYGAAGPLSLSDSVIWGATQSLGTGVVAVTYSDVQLDSGIAPGAGNLNRQPWFLDELGRDFRLQSISPCRGAAGDFGDMGALFPVGAAPTPPASLRATNVTATAVTLLWQDLSDDEAYFAIERQGGDGVWIEVGRTGAGVTQYTDATLAQAASYRFRVAAAHNRGQSLYTESVSVTPETADITQLLRDSLRITEIMYNPAPGGATGDGFEYLEVGNLGSATLDLTGCYFSQGIDYAFPNGSTLAPGSHYVIVRNPTTFAQRYPGVTIRGVFANSTGLNNGGERITLCRNSDQTEIVSVKYADSWYPSTDGAGYSLVLADPQGDPDLAISWIPSAALQGSPGADDPPDPYGRVLINEVLAHTDPPLEGAIELWNGGGTTVDLSGWYLSDASDSLTKYQIPLSPPTRLAPGAFKVFYAGTSFAKPGVSNPFELSAAGETVYLSSGNGTGLTGYRVGAEFPATENGRSVGRHVRSDGKTDFVRLEARTFGFDTPATLEQFRTGTGRTNALPAVGPVVISEVMYNPAAGGKEFIELTNLAATTVPLVSSEAPTNTWRVTGDIRYTFPPATALAAGERVLLCSVPEAEFRLATGVTNPAVRVFGPWDGSLANSGGRITLSMPEQLGPALIVSVPVDSVDYRDSAPWPEFADNGGGSLERVDEQAYGNDPANWISATPGGTPGSANNIAGLPTLAFETAGSKALERDTAIEIPVTLAPLSTATVTVAYAVSGGTATPGSDFVPVSGALTFWPYETRKTIRLHVLEDAEAEVDETVTIALQGESPNVRLGGNWQHTHEIIDSDAADLPPPVMIPSKDTDFTNSILVHVVSRLPGGVVRYTLDGTVPVVTSPRYTAPLLIDRSARVTARTFLGSGNAGPWSSVLFREQAPPTGWVPPPLVTNRAHFVVMDANDDGFEGSTSGTVYLSTLTNCMGRLGVGWAGYRFGGGALPAGARILGAEIQFWAAESQSGATRVEIYGEATDSPAAFGAVPYNLSGRTRTQAKVAWTPPEWTRNACDAEQRTPDIAAVISEIASRPGRASDAPFVILVKTAPLSGFNPSYRTAYNYELNPQRTALLSVTWEPAGAATSHFFRVLVSGEGQVAGGNLDVPHGSNATAVATAAPYHGFAGWSGDTGGGDTNAPALTVLMDRERTVTATFNPLLAANGTPHWWLASYGLTNNFDAEELGDPDLDTMLTWQEYRADTVPTSAASLLEMRGLTVGGQGATVRWLSRPTRSYSVFRTHAMESAFGPAITGGLAGATGGTNVYLDASVTNRAFYRIGVGPSTP